MRIIFLILLLTLPLASNAQQILASSSQIASILSLLTGDKIDTLSGVSSCPHHYSLKPSDISKIEEADFIIYIDDKFEPFSDMIKAKAKGKLLQISDIDNIKIRNENYHIWHDIDNAKLILKEAANYIPNNRLENAQALLGKLHIRKKHILSRINHPIIMSDSLEYFFDGVEVGRMFVHYHSANIFDKISKVGPDGFFLADSAQDLSALAKKTNIRIIYIDSEKWGDMDYVKNYNRILDTLEGAL